jgi:hypothetical protein
VSHRMRNAKWIRFVSVIGSIENPSSVALVRHCHSGGHRVPPSRLAVVEGGEEERVWRSQEQTRASRAFIPPQVYCWNIPFGSSDIRRYGMRPPEREFFVPKYVTWHRSDDCDKGEFEDRDKEWGEWPSRDVKFEVKETWE